jgi:hypothetical protein
MFTFGIRFNWPLLTYFNFEIYFLILNELNEIEGKISDYFSVIQIGITERD